MRWLATQPPERAGIVLVAASSSRLLLVQRPWGTWEQPGGHVEAFESHEEAALRELGEETGYNGAIELAPDSIDTGPRYRVFYGFVRHEFRAVLSREHIASRWVSRYHLPPETHPGTCTAVSMLS